MINMSLKQQKRTDEDRDLIRDRRCTKKQSKTKPIGYKTMGSKIEKRPLKANIASSH